MTIAPAGFGEFSGDLLVGNFGDGRIHAFDPTSLALRGAVRKKERPTREHRRPLGVAAGNGVEGGTDEVLFTAGPQDEAHGLLGSLSLRS